MKTQHWGALLALLLLAACSTVPRDLRGAGEADSSISLASLRSHTVEANGQLVRWGGMIARVQNKDNQSWIEIVEKPLDRSGRPLDENVTGGRFMAIFDRFLDPLIFSQGREITVQGALQPAVDGKVGEQAYQYFVVTGGGLHLWEPRPIRDYERGYFIMSSWWDPWWYQPVFIYRGGYYPAHHYRDNRYYDRNTTTPPGSVNVTPGPLVPGNNPVPPPPAPPKVPVHQPEPPRDARTVHESLPSRNSDTKLHDKR